MRVCPQRAGAFIVYDYLLWNRYLATKVKTPMTFAKVVVSKVIRTDTSKTMIPRPHKNTITNEVAM